MTKKLTKKSTKTLKNIAANKKAPVRGRVITVKNTEDTPDTTATILIQNKINYTPKVSVIIPVFNAADYLIECLNSVTNQTLSEIEIICVNDGSVDSSLEILQDYAKKDSRITVINQENHGAGIARNCGIGVARGEFVAFMDPDDFYPTNKTLEHLYNTAIEKQVNICGGTMNCLKDGKIIVADEYLFNEYGLIKYSDYQFDYGYTRFIYNRKWLFDNNVLFPDYLRGQDPVFFVRAMILARKFYAIDETTYVYRINYKEIKWTQRKLEDAIKSWIDVLKISKDNNLLKLHKNILGRLNTNWFINIFKNLYNMDSNTDLFKKIYDVIDFKHIDSAAQPTRLLDVICNWISVIVPVYNVEKYLSQCLDSVINQTYKQLEILCINDGSTDGSLKILEQYAAKDKRIRIISKENEGLSATRNLGIRQATGKYILFLDSDDWLDLTCFENLFNSIEANKSDLCIYGLTRFDESSNSCIIPDNYFNLSCYKNVLDKPTCTYLDIQTSVFRRWESVVKLYRRGFLLDNNILFTEKVLFEDIFFHIQSILSAKSICFCDKNLYYYRVNRPNSIMDASKANIKCLDIFKAFEDIKAFLLNKQITILNNEYVNFVLKQADFHYKRCVTQELKKIFIERLKDFVVSTDFVSDAIQNNQDFNARYRVIICDDLVSVIIPVYNVEKYLAQCLDSVINQTYKNIEIICVNDGSTDNSLKILEQYAKKDARIKIISQQNAGLSAARNTGLKQVNSEHVLFLDSDDYISNDAIETLYTNLIESNSDVSIGDVHIFGDAAKIDMENSQKWFDKFVSNVGKHDMPLDIRANLCPTAWNKLYKMSIINAYNLEFPVGLINEDEYWLWAYMVHCKNYVISDKKTYFYLQRKNSIMGQRFVNKKVLDLIDIHKQIVLTLKKQNLFDKYKNILSNWFVVHMDTIIKKLPIELYNDALKGITDYTTNYYKDDILKKYLIKIEKLLSVKIITQADIDYIPKISIIIPIYNAGKYLSKCLDSVITQTIKDIEIICIDDGSTDESLKILKEYAKADRRISIITQKNQRQGAARNKGIKFASGKYLLFVDADDWLDKHALKLLYQKISNEKSDVCIYGITTYDEQTKITHVDNWRDTSLYSSRLTNPTNWRDIKSAVFTHFGPVYKLYNRNFIVEQQLFFQENVIYEDVVFSVKSMLLANKISILDKNLYFYRCNTNVSTMDKSLNNPHIEDIMSFLVETYEFLVHMDLWLELKNEYLLFVLGQAQFHITRIPDIYKSELLDKLNKFIYDRNLYQNIISNDTLKKLYYSLYKTKFTVIIPVYNTQEFLSQCLDSVINQTLKDIEIICINDGSTDDSLEILKEYQRRDSRIKIINQKNSGLSIARNKAMKIANGEYFDFLDSDDYLQLDTLEILYNYCKLYNLDMLSFSGWNFNNGSNHLEENPYWSYNYLPKKFDFIKLYGAKDYLPIMDKMHISSCLTVYKRKFIQGEQIVFPEGLCFEDNIFFYKSLTKTDSVGLLNKKLYYRRVHKSSITQNKTAHLYDYIKITDMLLEYLKYIKLDYVIFNKIATQYFYGVKHIFQNSKQQKKYIKYCNELFTKYGRQELIIQNICSLHNNLAKCFILLPYLLLANIYMKHIKLPVLRTKKHINQFLYTHSYRGRMDFLNANFSKIMQSIQSVQSNTNKQIANIQNQQNEFARLLNSELSVQKKLVESKYNQLNKTIAETMETFDTGKIELDNKMDTILSKTNSSIHSISEHIETKHTELLKYISDSTLNISEHIETKHTELLKYISDSTISQNNVNNRMESNIQNLITQHDSDKKSYSEKFDLFEKMLINIYTAKNGERTKDLEFRTFGDLAHCIRHNLHKIPNDIDLVVGIPRSGIIPAYIIALFMNKKCCSLDEFIAGIKSSNGFRNIVTTPVHKVLIVDDSIYSGAEIARVREKLSEFTDYSFTYMAVYARTPSANLVDVYLELVDGRRVWQWNYLNHSFANRACFDMDGVLCVDPTDEQNDDGQKYTEFIQTAKPLYVPNYKIRAIVTSRLEKYRVLTEKWLQEHNVQYQELIMLDLPSATERQKLCCHAQFKADIYKNMSDTDIFIESNPNQAKEIALKTGKQVLCVENDELY